MLGLEEMRGWGCDGVLGSSLISSESCVSLPRLFRFNNIFIWVLQELEDLYALAKPGVRDNTRNRFQRDASMLFGSNKSTVAVAIAVTVAVTVIAVIATVAMQIAAVAKTCTLSTFRPGP
ncbi:hypothetical protein Lal_00019187 [Lupinus albus]|nr:hypothetical protein Lal_00019187 [Lupinus albus]